MTIINIMSARVREGQFGDIISIYNLNRACLPIYYGYLDHSYMMIDPKFLYLVVEVDNRDIIGYLIGEHNGNNFHICSLGISDKFRGKGIGSFLFKKLESKIKNNCKNITLNVHVENTGAIKFYEKNNFKNIRLLKNYYSGSFPAKNHDAYFYSKKL